MQSLFVMDPLHRIQVSGDSTYMLMRELTDRNIPVWMCTPGELDARDGRGFARATRVLTTREAPHFEIVGTEELELGAFDVVWMRKDPPFNMDYIFSTYLLDLAARETLVVNAPEGLRSMNEKAWCLHFPDLVPPSLVTEDMDRLRSFCEEMEIAVVKPLDGNGGAGVFVVRADDPNIGVILEMSTSHGRTKVLAQRYLREATSGDKRIILVDGELVGACLRVPTGVDHRGNIHVGARCEATTLTAREREICAKIGPALKEAGQIFVGIDVIGDWLTEVNVTSPTCIHEINTLDGIRVDQLILDAVERRIERR